MANSKSQSMNGMSDHGNQRRAFFGRVVALIGGGFLGGGLLRKMLNSGSRVHRAETPIEVTVHPLAVPRSKEGSTTNV